MSNKHTIGLDIGGTKIAAALATLDGNILSTIVTPTNAKKGSSVVTDKLIFCINHLLKESKVKIDNISNIVREPLSTC